MASVKSEAPKSSSTRKADRDTLSSDSMLFDNFRGLEKPEAVAQILGISVKTIYDWRYRERQRKVPAGLFVTFNRRLYLRSDILQEWIASQNPSLR